MQLPPLLTTHLRRYNAIIYIVKNLLDVEDRDELPMDEIIDTLLVVVYGIDDLINELEK